MRVWAKRLRIFNSIREHGKQSVRRLAERTGLAKSSVHRPLQAMARRDRPPESWWWETAEGRGWLLRLVVATRLIFGLKRGVGAETISEFFSRLRLAAQVGCSPSALRGVMQGLDHAILEIAAAWERDGVAHGEIRPLIGAVDETFLQRLMLVLVELTGGDRLGEEVARDRPYDTWPGLVKERLRTLGVGVLSLVSDRAKALIKLAETGLGCLSIPDLFHLIHELVKSYSLVIFHRLRQAQPSLIQARLGLPGARCRVATQLKSSRPKLGWRRVKPRCSAGNRCALSIGLTSPISRCFCIALASLPGRYWRLLGSTRQSSPEVDCQWQAELTALETWVETHGLPLKKNALDKVRKPLAGGSARVGFGWQRVRQDLEQVALTPEVEPMD